MSEQMETETPLLVVEDQQGVGDQKDAKPEYTPQWGPITRLIMTILLIVAAIYGLTLLAPIFDLLATAFLIGYLIKSGADALANRTRISYGAAVALLYLVFAVSFISLILVLIPPLVNGINSSINRARDTYEDLRMRLEAYEPEDGIVEVLRFELDLNPIIEPARDLILQVEEESAATVDDPTAAGESEDSEPTNRTAVNTSQLEQLLRQALNIAGQVGTTITGVFSTISGLAGTLIFAVLISIFALIDLPKTSKALYSALPVPYHREVRLLLKEIEHVWDSFFRGSVLVSIVVTILTWIYLLLVGVPSAFVLAFIIGAFNLIPYISTLITLVILLIVPIFTGSTVFTEMSGFVFAGIVFVGYLPISAFIFNVIAPKIQGDAVNLPISVVFVGVLIGTAIGGFMGALLAAPLMGTLRVLIVYVMNKIAMQDPFPDKGDPGSPEREAAASA